ncbi:transglycosylase SLT domain-containing protein [Cognatiluteimonas profundi]|uniref:LysM peptidoglycan-binding domain-containing protein n=1 Tax=Cognatiluteimonas profundi TaxID=2594501 RepID=UPI00131E0635|nr:transglycosylase SLT domain-containing protein [Lysobacter profundi]
MNASCRRLLPVVVLLLAAKPAWSQQPTPAATRSGGDIYAQFRAGLADPHCDHGGSSRWRGHFAAAPARLAAPSSDVMPLFGYVVDAVRAAGLPTEYALIPFVESGYKPGARSAGGPAGLWQMIAVTARDHAVPIRAGYDGRLSPVDSTRAAVRYLKTLHGMFAGDWRLAVMAYNAGEYRVFSALRQSGQVARSADPEKLTSLSGITRAYVRKLHALSCLFDQADDDNAWLQALDRPVPILRAIAVPPGTTSLRAWSAVNGWDSAQMQRLNPAFADGRIASAGHPDILAPAASTSPAMGAPAGRDGDAGSAAAPDADKATPVAAMATADSPARRTHRVSRGDSLQRIAKRYKVRLGDLLLLNGLASRSVLRPGMVLKLDAAPGE